MKKNAETAHYVSDNLTTTTPPPPTLPQPQAQRSVSSTVVRPIANKIQPQLWKPWLYSASLYQDWISRLSQQHLNFTANSTPVGEINSNTNQDKTGTSEDKACIKFTIGQVNSILNLPLCILNFDEAFLKIS